MIFFLSYSFSKNNYVIKSTLNVKYKQICLIKMRVIQKGRGKKGEKLKEQLERGKKGRER